MFFPIQKKVDLALCRSRRSKIEFVNSGCGPSSKVIAIFLEFNDFFDVNVILFKHSCFKSNPSNSKILF